MVNRPGTRPFRAYAAAALLTVIALAATDAVERAIGFQTYLLLIPIVIFASAYWGAILGTFTTALVILGMAVQMEPARSIAMTNRTDQARTVLFVGVAAISIWLASRQFRLAQDLRANETELRAIFDLAAVGTGMVDPRTGRFMRVNDALCAMTGYSREELLARTVADITHPEDRERDREIIAALMAGTKERWSIEKRYVHKEGAEVWVLVNGTIVHGEAGEPDHMIAHAADVTDRRRADDALREASRLKDEFLATLSHELRTPLNVVVGWTHILSREQTPPNVGRALAVIARNTDALRRLTEDLIGLSSVLTGRVRLDRHLVDLHAVLDDALESVALAAAAKGLSIDTRIEGRLLVLGDEARLRQIFWNLLSNAVKFTQAGGTVTVATQTDGDRISIEVADTGIGIPATFLPHVFDKFRQEDASHTREHQGLGLGLTIAHQLAELHGGTIAAFSEGRNRGTVFTVTLPAADVSAPTLA